MITVGYYELLTPAHPGHRPLATSEAQSKKMQVADSRGMMKIRQWAVAIRSRIVANDDVLVIQR